MTQTNFRKSEVCKNFAFNKFKVCLITNSSLSGGVGVYTSHLYETLKSHNIELKLVCTDPLIDDPNVAILNKQNLFPLNHFLNYFINPKRLPKEYDVYHVLSQSIGIFAKNNRPSIVTVHDISVLIDKQIMQPTPSFMSAQAKNIYNNQFINNIYYNFAKKSIEASKAADKIICDSSFTKDELIRYFRIPPHKISVIYLGVDRNTFKQRNKESVRTQLNLPKDYTFLLSIGDEGPRKNIVTVLRALNLLVNKKRIKKIALLRVGERRRSTQDIIEKFKLCDNAFYFDKIPKSSIPYFYNASDLLVYPSLYEGFGLPLIEAMASACPIVASNQSSIPEIVQNAGILIPPKDANLLADSILNILENKQLRLSLIENGLRRVKDFSWKECAQKTITEYQSLI
jgi:glycosyltransferase involved in cell wall biosynthesis